MNGHAWEALFDHLADLVPWGVLIEDTLGTVVAVNRALGEVFRTPKIGRAHV